MVHSGRSMNTCATRCSLGCSAETPARMSAGTVPISGRIVPLISVPSYCFHRAGGCLRRRSGGAGDDPPPDCGGDLVVDHGHHDDHDQGDDDPDPLPGVAQLVHDRTDTPGAVYAHARAATTE